MFFLISKLTGFLTTPIVWIAALLLYGFFRKKRKPILAAGALLLFFSNAFVLDEAMRAWEVPAVHLDDLEKDYDAAIVLAGMVGYDEDLDRIAFFSNSDRMLQAVDLYRRGYVKKIFISGGSGSLTEEARESELLRDYLVRVGLPEEDILIESASRNTRENALYTAEALGTILPRGKFLLVTSSVHMRRSLACFEKAGIRANPFVTNRHSGDRKFYPDHLLVPNAEALHGWNGLIHEWVGYAVYRLLGYA